MKTTKHTYVKSQELFTWRVKVVFQMGLEFPAKQLPKKCSFLQIDPFLSGAIVEVT